MKRIVVLGGAGDMAGVACRRLAELRKDVHMVLADRQVERARQRALSLGPAFSAHAVDILDPQGLRQLVSGASLVVNAAGPYSVLGRPALQAAMDCRADYIDFSDESEAAESMLELHRDAQEAGITALIGAGVAPGLVNVLVRYLNGLLDEADGAQVAWVTGASPRQPGQLGDGRAVIEHMLHSCIGKTFTVRNGQRQPIAAFRHSEVLPFPEPLGDCRVYDIGHSELVTVPRSFPGMTRVRCQGAIQPAALNGLFQGLARAVERERITFNAALDCLMDLERGVTPRFKPALAALGGILRQWLRGELRARDLTALMRLMRDDAEQHHAGGLYIRVEGRLRGRRAAWVSRAASLQTADQGGMDEVTGTPLACFAHLMLDGKIRQPGVHAPEAIVDPRLLHQLFSQVGGHPGIAPLFEPELQWLQ